MVTDSVKGCLVSEKEAFNSKARKNKENMSEEFNKMTFGLTTNKLNFMNNRTLELGSVCDLIHPKEYNNFNLSSEEMTKKREKTEISEILEKVNLKYKKGIFQGIWKKAIEIEGIEPHFQINESLVSMISVIEAIKQLKAIPC